jgi:hypothetical protein
LKTNTTVDNVGDPLARLTAVSILAVEPTDPARVDRPTEAVNG